MYYNFCIYWLQESYERAKAILRNHSTEHKALAKALMKYETLDVDDIKTIVDGKKLSRTGDKNTSWLGVGFSGFQPQNDTGDHFTT